jgi:protein-disulfide isomerase
MGFDWIEGERRSDAQWLRATVAVVATVILGLSASGRGVAQDTETETLRKRVQALETRQRALEAEIQELKRLLGSRQVTGPAPAAVPPPGPALTVSIAGAPFKGNRTAPVTVVEFSDYECGFCGRHARETIPQLDREFIQTGKVKYVFKSFPNEAIHKLAMKAHEAAACAGDQGQYWPMHDRLFAKPGGLAPAALLVHGRGLGLGSAFEQCLASAKYTALIRQELAAGRAAGVTATPTFFLATAGTSPDQPKVVRTIRGAKPFAVFKQAIEQLLMP